MNHTPQSNAGTEASETVDLRGAPHPKIPELQQRRSQVKAAMEQVQQSLADSGLDPAVWLARLDSEVQGLRAAFDHHVSVHEVDSFFAEILHGRPHLISHVRRLEQDHQSLDRALVALQSQLGAARTDASAAAAEVQRSCRELLESLARHRRRGATLVWEAFNHDLGGED